MEFYVLATYKVISGQVLTCDSVHCWWLYSASPASQSRPPALWYPIPSHYPDTELTRPCPSIIMLSAWLGSDKYQFDKLLFWLGRGSNSRPAFLLIRPSRPVKFISHRPRPGIKPRVYWIPWEKGSQIIWPSHLAGHDQINHLTLIQKNIPRLIFFHGLGIGRGVVFFPKLQYNL